jgi:hypothetical protein
MLALITLATIGAIPTAADPLPGQEQESRILSDRLNVTLGGYQPDFSTNIAAGFGGVLGAFIDVEQTLGLQEDLGVFATTGFYRFRPKHGIDWGYNVLNRDGVRTIDETIKFGDPPMEFRVGAEVATTFNSTLFAVNYRYSFINNGKVDAGVSAGLFTYTYDLELTGEASVQGDPGMSTTLESADARVLAPLPAFGIFVNYAVRKNLIFRAEVRALNIEISDFIGKFSDVRFTLDWYFYKHLGIGIGSSRTSIDFQDKGSDPFLVEYSYGGFMGYLSIVF